MLLFNFFFFSPHPCPLLFIFYSILWLLFCFFSGLSDAVGSELIFQMPELSFFPFLFLMLRLSWLMLHLWWVLFWFCFVLQIVVRRGEYWVFSLFSFLSHSSYFINHRSVTQSKKSDSTVYFFHWYLFIGHLYVFFMCIAFLWRANRTQGRGVSLSLAFYHCVQKAKYCIQPSHYHTVHKETYKQVKIETYSTVRWRLYCGCLTLFCLPFTLSEGPIKQTAHG